LPPVGRWLNHAVRAASAKTMPDVPSDDGCGLRCRSSTAIQSLPAQRIRMVRSRDPLAFIMFDWVLGADLFLP
jgi:hypothetical protein